MLCYMNIYMDNGTNNMGNGNEIKQSYFDGGQKVDLE